MKELRKKRVHRRNIEIETYDAGEGRILIEGRLNDSRDVAITTFSGKSRPPGPVHGMVLRWLVGGMPPGIIDVEVEFPTIPMEECADAGESVKRLVGLHVVYGFSKEVKDRLGGTIGCSHLTALALAMGPAAVQGLAAMRGERLMSAGERKIMANYVKNTCVVWREDGDFLKQVLANSESETD